MTANCSWYLFSKNETKYIIDAWIKYLVAIASDSPLDLYYVSAARNRVYHVDESRRSRKGALRSLQKLVQLYKSGHEEVFMFYPDFNKSPADIAALTSDKFRTIVKKYLENDTCDVYLKKESSFGFFNSEEVFEQYVQNSEEVFGEVKELFDAYYSAK